MLLALTGSLLLAAAVLTPSSADRHFFNVLFFRQIQEAVRCFQASQQEAPRSSLLLGLPKHRLHDRFALGVDLAPCLQPQLAGHGRFGIQILGDRLMDRGWWFAVPLSARGDGGIDASLLTG